MFLFFLSSPVSLFSLQDGQNCVYRHHGEHFFDACIVEKDTFGERFCYGLGRHFFNGLKFC